MESTMQQRRDEILAKKAKLAELKRQRELRKEQSANRQSLNGSPLAEVRLALEVYKQTLSASPDNLTNTKTGRRPRQADDRRQSPHQ
jgi:hypothetical protein